MKHILLIYSPFCTPATPPYSITNLAAFLRGNCKEKVEMLDLNIIYHKKTFPDYYKYCKTLRKDYDPEEYTEKTDDFIQESGKAYKKNNWLIRENKHPDLFDESLSEIMKFKPDIVAFSVVYSSQVFYTYALMNELKKKGIKVVVGGPAVSDVLKKEADAELGSGVELLKYVSGNKPKNFDTIPEFTGDYFVPEPVIPLQTSNSCNYKKCAYCTHHSDAPYVEFSLDNIRETVKQSGQKYFFLIDDTIPKKRLLEIAGILKPLKVYWTCQLRPTLDKDTLQELYDSGLRMILWGVESGCDRVLKLIGKGTTKKGVMQVLKDAHSIGIKNVAYVIFGFPTETKDEFRETIKFLQDADVDLVSASIFGLQEGALIFKDLKKYGITKVHKEKRTLLGPKITYEVSSGMTQEEAARMRSRHKGAIELINKFPKRMNFFREHMLVLLGD